MQVKSLLLALAGLAVAHDASKVYDTRYEGVSWDDENWTIKTAVLDPGKYQSRISLSNGYFGSSLAAVGPFMEYDVPFEDDNINGWPLFDRRQAFATIAGFYDSVPRLNGSNYPWLYQYGYEGAISGIPHFGGLLVQWEQQILNSTVPKEQISNFSSSLNIQEGLMTWEYDWQPSGGPSFGIKYEMIVHKLYVNQAATKLEITTHQDANVTVVDVLDGDCATRTNYVDAKFDKTTQTIYSAVSPFGLSNVTAYVYSVLRSSHEQDLASLTQTAGGSYTGGNQSSIGQAVINIPLQGGQTRSFTKFVGAASSDAFPDPQRTALDAARKGAQSGWDTFASSHAKEWGIVLPKDSVDSYASPETGKVPDDENVLELQITAVSNPFYLLQNTVSPNAIIAAQNNSRLNVDSISVGGLGSPSYAGHIFWDADVWMAPGLIVSHPEAAKNIAGYRTRFFDQAKENVKTAYQSSQNETGRFSEGGAVYPWTASRFGNCTGTGPCFDYQYHLNGDISLQLLNEAIVTGDAEFFNQSLFPVHDAVAWFFGELVELNDTTGLYNLYNASDPDEYANNIDNPGFTMTMIKTHLERANVLRERMGLPANTSWANIAEKIYIPTNDDAKIILEYPTQNGSITIKQASVTLVDDFLDYDNPYALSSLDYYAGKQSKDGPAMTYSSYSIVANEFSPSGCSAYTYNLYSSQPYARAPWFQFSEQLIDSWKDNGGTHPAFPFLTGIGGANRVTVFGYLGLRLLLDSLNVDPNLPPQITNLKYRTIYWQGHAIVASSNQTHTTLSRSGQNLPRANPEFASSPIPVTIGYNINDTTPLPPNGTIIIPNRLIGYNATKDGNILQCKPANSSQGFLPGQFPLAAVDGAISTKWQPSLSNVTASVAIDVGTEGASYRVAGFHLDWSQKVPTEWSVDISNSSDWSAFRTAYSQSNVTISQPYDAATANIVKAYEGNTTDYTFPAATSGGRYYRLNIKGNQGADPEQGATVAEFAVLRENGGRLVPNSVISSLNRTT